MAEQLHRAKPELKAWSVADEIKRQFFENYLETQRHYIAYNLKKSKAKRRRFVSRVIALSMDLSPKINKLSFDTPRFDCLKKLSSRDKTMSFEKAEEYFMLERELLELNGITAYETYTSPADRVFAGAFTGKSQVGIK